MTRIYILSTMGGMDIWGAYSTRELADKALEEAKRLHWNEYAKWSVETTNLDPPITNANDISQVAPARARRKP